MTKDQLVQTALPILQGLLTADAKSAFPVHDNVLILHAITMAQELHRLAEEACGITADMRVLNQQEEQVKQHPT